VGLQVERVKISDRILIANRTPLFFHEPLVDAVSVVLVPTLELFVFDSHFELFYADVTFL